LAPEAAVAAAAAAVATTKAPGALGPARSASEFRRDKFLGKGTYGSVWKVTRLASNKVYALKEVDMRAKKQSEREESVNEIRLLASARHPNIIRYRDSFFDNDHLYIVRSHSHIICTEFPRLVRSGKNPNHQRRPLLFADH